MRGRDRSRLFGTDRLGADETENETDEPEPREDRSHQGPRLFKRAAGVQRPHASLAHFRRPSDVRAASVNTVRDNRDMNRFENWRERIASGGRVRLLQIGIVILAVVTVVPVGVVTYQRVQQVRQDARANFIRLHRLWELHPEFKGTPETWTRFASRLLTDRQIMFRVNAKYGALAEQIELDYRRDLTIAQSEVVFGALGIWALPLLAVYGIGYILIRRPRVDIPVKVDRPSLRDPRYLPTPPVDNNGEKK
jgi:hypothetical protein